MSIVQVFYDRMDEISRALAAIREDMKHPPADPIARRRDRAQKRELMAFLQECLQDVKDDIDYALQYL